MKSESHAGSNAYNGCKIDLQREYNQVNKSIRDLQTTEMCNPNANHDELRQERKSLENYLHDLSKKLEGNLFVGLFVS